MALDSGTLVPLVRKLKALGLVARQRSAVDDRVVLISPTPASMRLRQRAHTVHDEVACAPRCSSTQRQALARSLQGLRAALLDGVPAPNPVALVDALNTLSGGPHAGYRANHAKGVLVAGAFTPAPAAASLSKAPHFAQSVPVLVRFSNTTGVPIMPDGSADASPHGIAIRFQLPGGASTDIVSISANGFPVATPEDFLALLRAVAKAAPVPRSHHRSSSFWAATRPP